MRFSRFQFISFLLLHFVSALSAASSLWIRKGGEIYEPARGGQLNKIVVMADGRLLTTRIEKREGKNQWVYAELRPETLSALMEEYRKDPIQYKNILNNTKNQVVLRQQEQNNVPRLEIKNGVPYEVIGESRRQIFQLHTGLLHTQDTSFPVNFRSVHPKVLTELMSHYAKNPSKHVEILAHPWNYPSDREISPRIFTQSEWASELYWKPVKKEANSIYKDSSEWRKKAEERHRYWAKRIQEVGGFDNLSEKEKRDYNDDLTDFEKGILLHEYVTLMENKEHHSKSEEELELLAVNQILDAFKEPAELRELTLQRLTELSKVTFKNTPYVKPRLKYPNLRSFILARKTASDVTARLRKALVIPSQSKEKTAHQ